MPDSKHNNLTVMTDLLLLTTSSLIVHADSFSSKTLSKINRVLGANSNKGLYLRDLEKANAVSYIPIKKRKHSLFPIVVWKPWHIRKRKRIHIHLQRKTHKGQESHRRAYSKELKICMCRRSHICSMVESHRHAWTGGPLSDVSLGGTATAGTRKSAQPTGCRLSWSSPPPPHGPYGRLIPLRTSDMAIRRKVYFHRSANILFTTRGRENWMGKYLMSQRTTVQRTYCVLVCMFAT